MKVISGGQKGVDRIGLEAARSSGIETGGWAPYNFQTEDGPDLTLRDFGLRQLGGTRGYAARTEQNVIDGDGTVLFGDMSSSGSKMTIGFCKKHSKPYIINPTAASLRDWLFANNIQTLNVAGNRASKLTKAQMTAYWNTLKLAFIYWKDPDHIIFPD